MVDEDDGHVAGDVAARQQSSLQTSAGHAGSSGKEGAGVDARAHVRDNKASDSAGSARDADTGAGAGGALGDSMTTNSSGSCMAASNARQRVDDTAETVTTESNRFSQLNDASSRQQKSGGMEGVRAQDMSGSNPRAGSHKRVNVDLIDGAREQAVKARRFVGLGSSILESEHGQEANEGGEEQEEDEGDGPMVVDFIDETVPGSCSSLLRFT